MLLGILPFLAATCPFGLDLEELAFEVALLVRVLHQRLDQRLFALLVCQTAAVEIGLAFNDRSDLCLRLIGLREYATNLEEFGQILLLALVELLGVQCRAILQQQHIAFELWRQFRHLHVEPALARPLSHLFLVL